MGRAAPARAPRQDPRRAPQKRRRPQVVARSRRPRRRIRLGLTIIPIIAALFAGVIYVNSAELRVTKAQGNVTRQTIEVQEQIASLEAQRARRDLIVRNRAGSLGFVTALTEDLNFVTARPAPRR